MNIKGKEAVKMIGNLIGSLRGRKASGIDGIIHS